MTDAEKNMTDVLFLSSNRTWRNRELSELGRLICDRMFFENREVLAMYLSCFHLYRPYVKNVFSLHDRDLDNLEEILLKCDLCGVVYEECYELLKRWMNEEIYDVLYNGRLARMDDDLVLRRV